MGMYKKVLEGIYNLRSLLIHGRFKSPRWDFSHHIVPPKSENTAYRVESVERGGEGFKRFANLEYSTRDEQPIYIYDRLHEPTKGMLEERIAFAEKGEVAITFSSGMGAIAASLMINLKSGDELIAHNTLYGCTYSLITNWLPRYGIKIKLLDFTKYDELEKGITDSTKVLYFETPVNPNLTIIDIERVSNIAKKLNEKRSEEDKIKVVVDNTFASPFCQRPREWGADFVVHSLTKHLNGFGTNIGGIVVSDLKYEPMLLLYRKDYGASLSSQAAWDILNYGLPTLPLRMKTEISNAMEVAKFLENHPMVEKVNYPGLESFEYYELAKKQMRDFDGNFAPSSLIYFILKGDPKEAQEKGKKFINAIAHKAYSITLAVSLGQIRTLIEHPSSMTHAPIPVEEQIKAGIDPGGIRLSIGIEDVNDIIRDLELGFKEIS